MSFHYYFVIKINVTNIANMNAIYINANKPAAQAASAEPPQLKLPQ